MVNTSKILTVSYGTFSCTLEGFDDSFDTMKAIAEYFRDLASDDRYFGAEPPVPDTEMLARIAEREISRRVDASESEGNYVLRAHSEAPQSRIADGAGLVAAASLPDADQNTGRVDTTQETPSHLLAETPSVAKEDYKEDSIKEIAVVEAATIETAFEDIEQDIDDLVGRDDTPSQTQPEEEFDGFIQTTAAPLDPDSVAAKLKRIRAVVSQNSDQNQDVTADDGFNEDEHAVDFGVGEMVQEAAQTPADTLGEAISELSHAIEIDDVAEAAVVKADVDEIASAPLSQEISQKVEDPAPKIEEIHAQDIEDDFDDLSDDLTKSLLEDEDDNDDEIADFLARMNDRDSDLGGAENDGPEDDVDDVDDGYSIFAEEDEETAPQEEAQKQQTQAAPIRARVLKMKRTDFEAAVAQGQLEEEFDQDAQAENETSLSDHDEAELQRELDAVQSEIGAQVEEVEAEVAFDEPIEAAPVNVAPRSRASIAPRESDQDVSRILAETNQQLDEPEGKTRRNAIAHLRAAVAATQAEKAAGNDTTVKEDTSGAYRDDLADVVRPRRPRHPAASQHRDQRPAAAAPAPLKLVAEQRIDPQDAPSRQPVRPRRISMAQMAAESEAAAQAHPAPDGEDYGSFSEFAEEVGAVKLPDLLEAAAAYLAFVEGREKFSRPQLMTKVRQVELDDFSREDGLRSFGQLLRQGKIQKLKGGRFTVSERIGYKPDERYVG